MVAYEFYCRDKAGKEHLIGILPERRANPERMTKNSILNWGWTILGDHPDVNHIYFVKIETDKLRK
jgi:hypothetical protein